MSNLIMYLKLLAVIDPQNPTGAPANSTSEKKDLLIRELLTNTAEAGDIPFDTPVVVARDIPFLVITAQDIRKIILGAGNITPGIDKILRARLDRAYTNKCTTK
jgi:hypothetical protein